MTDLAPPPAPPRPELTWTAGPGAPSRARAIRLTADARVPASTSWSHAATDLTGRSPAVRVRLTGADELVDLTVRLTAGDGAFVWRVLPDALGGPDRPPLLCDGQEAVLTLSFADVTLDGRPDRTAVTGVTVGLTAKGPSTAEISGMGSMPEPSRFPRGLLTLTFDDSFASQATVALPELAERSLRGSVVPILGRLDTGPEHLSRRDVDEMIAQGWEVTAHALTDETHQLGSARMTEQQREHEFTELRRQHAEMGWTADTFAYPGGWWSAEAGAHALRHFTGVRSAYAALTETWPPTEPDRIRTVLVMPSTHPDGAALAAEIDRAMAHRAWTVLTFHGLVAAGGAALTPLDTPADAFRALLDRIVELDVPVLTLREALGFPVSD
ncbi:polysaccharide deacetylase family protein [Nakamurella leprariae]|uniref:Polysaccharide deacetylase family protein n=1 Tax=Nakamurella leprariae TaxID=2803911 RepID=A0A938YB46_9ACTN|nr:polysaccharide deacetylase family protein [Nakamurella leprariae]MBM9466549.1 polysaccharide deacetylase family protein [Nakamurella leprariae]